MNSCCWLGHRIVENSEKKDWLGRDSSLLVHVHLCLADRLISDGFNSLWGGSCSWPQKEGKFSLSQKGTYRNKCSTLSLQNCCKKQNLAMNEKTEWWCRSENRGDSPSGRIVSNKLHVWYNFGIFWNVLQDFILSQSRRNGSLWCWKGKAQLPSNPRSF